MSRRVERFFAAVGSKNLDLIERLAVGAKDWPDLLARVRAHHAAEVVKLDAKARRLKLAAMRSSLERITST